MTGASPRLQQGYVIGVEIEDLFGDDPNDLPLDAIGAWIENAVAEIAAG